MELKVSNTANFANLDSLDSLSDLAKQQSSILHVLVRFVEALQKV